MEVKPNASLFWSYLSHFKSDFDCENYGKIQPQIEQSLAQLSPSLFNICLMTKLFAGLFHFPFLINDIFQRFVDLTC